MPEILQIFDHSPPSHHQNMNDHHLKRDLVNAESEFPSSDIFDVPGHFGCSDFVGSSFTNLMTSSVDELSKVTAVIEQKHNLKKRKLEFDVVEGESRKQSAECDSGLVEPPKPKRKTRKSNPKPKVEPRSDYIHVRARRGQATDSHSLAERARREKIKKKMQFLQDLVPGCSTMTNKAAILDNIITYVICLQREIEVLRMQLAASTMLN